MFCTSQNLLQLALQRFHGVNGNLMHVTDEIDPAASEGDHDELRITQLHKNGPDGRGRRGRQP